MSIRPPHCDQRVLHAPEDNCQVCNGHPEWQELRELWGINFTGHNDPDKLPCPAQTERSIKDINQWRGNVPLTPDVLKALDEFKTSMTEVVEELTEKRRRQYWGIE
jgi:hypothetical protein